MLVANPVIIGQSYPLKEGTPEHPLRGSLKPGLKVKVLRALGSSLFEAETAEGKTATVHSDNLERGSFHEVAVKFLATAPTDRSYTRLDLKAEATEEALKRYFEQHADVEIECTNTMVQRLAECLERNHYEVMAVAHPGARAHYFFRCRKP
jgi:hypothetical protein